jgi:parvulin-like peptidyl-prolyl isomerase
MLAAFAIIGLTTGCKGGSSDSVATVNGIQITKKDFDEYLLRKPTVVVQTSNGPQEARVAETLGLQALRDLVNRQLTLQLAKDMGVSPSQDEIQKEIEFRVKRDPNYLQTLTSQNIGLDLIKRDVELELSRERIVTHGIVVTPTDVDKFISENPDKFRNPPTVNALFIVVTSPADKKQVDAELATGQNFQIVAERYSKAPNVRQTHARAAETDLEKYPTPFRKALENTTEGKTTDWIQAGPTQFLKFYVEGKTAASPIKIDDTIKEVVKRQLMVQKGMNATDLQSRLLAEFKKSKIDVSLDPLKSGWKSVSDALNAPSSGQTPSTPAK